MVTMETFLSIFLGIGLAASAGFRVFIPLFILSLASNLNWIPINDSWQWLGETPALITLGIAMLVEVLAYYIPFVDNILDSIAIPLATIAGTIAMASTLADLSPMLTWGLAIIAGGGTAAVINSSTAATRLASTTTTGGLGNPLLSTVETGTATAMSFVSIFLPVLAIILVVFIFFVGIKLFKRFIP
ncbi:DUF4126 domain-containing protein [Flavobacterium orientale]|uniref:DUF4126 domain-containing protein n=1 Tax=Flavobacterium orientale TaxID=1756020 RepID=A0A916Y320_9FLAO|nr:DUF4126 domain-containing protein [Flavobacterium orientale]GGD27795.1 hypothetical protein GCM10011343_17470 [Flavobacterium orientale]